MFTLFCLDKTRYNFMLGILHLRQRNMALQVRFLQSNNYR